MFPNFSFTNFFTRLISFNSNFEILASIFILLILIGGLMSLFVLIYDYLIFVFRHKETSVGVVVSRSVKQGYYLPTEQTVMVEGHSNTAVQNKYHPPEYLLGVKFGEKFTYVSVSKIFFMNCPHKQKVKISYRHKKQTQDIVVDSLTPIE